jgi:hypothetical protein
LPRQCSRRIDKADHIDVVRHSSSQCLHVFDEATVDPLEAADQAQMVQRGSVRKPALQHVPALATGAKAHHDVEQRRGR